MAGLGPARAVLTVAGGLTGAGIGYANEMIGGLSGIKGATPDWARPSLNGKLGQGFSDIRQACAEALDMDANEYGKRAKALEVMGQTLGAATGRVKIADAGGKVGKVIDGADAVFGIFRDVGGLQGMQQTVSGVKTGVAEQARSASIRLITREYGQDSGAATTLGGALGQHQDTSGWDRGTDSRVGQSGQNNSIF